MSHRFLFDANFHLLLKSIDQELADHLQQQGCLECGGPLHQADYPRSPCGLTQSLRELYETRLSFCCGNCRKRATSPSVRFFGRWRFPAPSVVLISVLQSGITERRCAQIKRQFGITVNESTWKRWRRWWRDMFQKTLFWQQAKGLCFPTAGSFPKAIWILLEGGIEQKLYHLLKFLSPLTAGFLCAV